MGGWSFTLTQRTEPVQHPATNDAKLFLDQWFGEGTGADPKGYILIWTSLERGGHSEWFNNLQSAAAQAVDSTTRNTYFGVCLAERGYGGRYRLHSKERKPYGLPGLWLDIDIAGEGHKKKRYPPTLDDARLLLADIPIQPTIVTATGGGIHAYWCFHEIWRFAGDAERDRARALTRRWHHLVLAAAESRGWTMDNVSDLERVMRMPGTWNVKDPKDPKPVTISETSNWRYNPEDFDLFLKDVKTSVEQIAVSRETRSDTEQHNVAQVAESKDVELMLDRAAEPPEKFDALLANSRRAKQTWEHKRKDFTDQSGSAYDQAMANFCVQAGYSFQETTDTLIAMRRKHRDPNLERKMREGYFKSTYEKALVPFREQHELNTKRTDAAQTFASADEDTRRVIALELFNETVGTELAECIAFKTKNIEYRFTLESGEKFVVLADDVWEFRRFRKVFFSRIAVVLPTMKQHIWENDALPLLINHIAQDGKTEEVLDEGSDEAAMGQWIEEYLIDMTIHKELTKDVYVNGDPLVDEEGNHYVRNDDVRRYIGRRLDNKIPVARMPSLLRSAGLEPTHRKITGTNQTPRYWKLPARKVVPFPKAKGDNE